MIKRLAICAAALSALAAAPASAQVVGEWKVRLDDDQTVTFTTMRDASRPYGMVGIGEAGGYPIVFVGQFRNLQWTGYWYWYGPRASTLGGHPGCPRPAVPTPGRSVPTTPADHYGGFNFDLNVAENQMGGSWKTVCSLHGNRGRTFGPFPVAIRRTATGTEPPAPPPAPGSTASKPRLLGEAEAIQGCAQRIAFKISTSGTSGVASTVFSSRYRLQPCVSDVVRTVKVEVVSPEGRRPSRLRLEGLRVNYVQGSTRPVMMMIPTGRTDRRPLAFAGEPRAGQLITSEMMSGAFCAAPAWLTWLEFSDGTTSREPVGVVFSQCGIRAHPEMVPPELRETERVRS